MFLDSWFDLVDGFWGQCWRVIAHLSVHDFLFQVDSPGSDFQWPQNNWVIGIEISPADVVDLIFISDPVVPFLEHEPVGKALPDGVIG